MDRVAVVVVLGGWLLAPSARADEPTYTCLSTSCENDYGAAWFERLDGTDLLGVGQFQHGRLVEGAMYELSALRTSRIDVDAFSGAIHRDDYAITLELESIGTGLRTPRGPGAIAWREPSGPQSTKIMWENGIYQFDAPASLVQRAEPDLVGSKNRTSSLRRLGDLVFMREHGQVTLAANVGRFEWFPGYDDLDTAVMLPDGTTGRLWIEDGVLRELPLPPAQPGRRWKANLRATTERIAADLTLLDDTLAAVARGIAELRDRDDLRKASGRMYSQILAAVRDADGLVDRIPTRERARRTAAFLLVRELARQQPAIEAAQDALAQAEVTAATQPVLAYLFGRPRLGPALALLAKLTP